MEDQASVPFRLGDKTCHPDEALRLVVEDPNDPPHALNILEDGGVTRYVREERPDPGDQLMWTYREDDRR